MLQALFFLLIRNQDLLFSVTVPRRIGGETVTRPESGGIN